MKTLRTVFLAAGVLTALLGTARAQQAAPSPLVEFAGQIKGLGDPDLLSSLAGVGIDTGGSLFLPGPVTPFPAPLFSGGGVTPIAQANYTLTLSSLMRTSVVQEGNVVTSVYSGGVVNIYSRPNGLFGSLGGFKTYAEDAPRFSQGGLLLTMSDLTLTSVLDLDANAFSVTGGGAFTGGALSSYLASQGVTSGSITSVMNAGSTAVSGDYTYAGAGQIVANVIPEPATLALFGAGLLPLGAFLRRRKA